MRTRTRKTASEAWLERSNPLTGMSIRDLQNVFDCARGGDTQRLHWIFNEIEAVNPVLLTCVERRASAVANFQWRVSERAAADGTLSAEQKDAAETFLFGIENLQEAFEHLDLAFFRGFAHCQPIWEKDGTVHEISLLESWKFVRQGGEWFFNPACTGLSQADMTSCADARLMTVTRRRPIDYPALGIHVRDAVGNRDWGRFLERHALPKPAVTMHQGATEEQRADYLAAAECVENGQVSVWPFGASLTDFAGGSRGVDPFKNFIEHQEKRIVLLATGGTLMSLAESGTGTLAGNAQADVWESIVSRDSGVIAQAVTRSLLRPYLEHAFPGRPVCVEFGFDFTKPPTPKEVAEVAATLKTAGWLIDKAELEEATGYTLEKAPETPPQGPGLGMFANKDAAPSLQTALPPFKTPSKKPDGQGEGEAVPALLGPFLRALQSDSKMISEEVEDLLNDLTPEKARALLDKLPELVPEDPTLAPLLAEEMAKAFGEAFTKAQKPVANKEENYVWEIVEAEVRDEIANKWNPEDHPRGGDEHFPQRFSAAPGASEESAEQSGSEKSGEMSNAERGKRIVEIASDPSAEPVMLGQPEGLETRLRVDPAAAAHIIGRRNQQRTKRIEKAKQSGDAELLAKAEAMMTGEQIAEILPDEVSLGKVVERRYDEKQRTEVVDITTPRLRVGAKKKSPSRKHRRGDREFGVSTAFPPDEEFASKTKRGGR